MLNCRPAAGPRDVGGGSGNRPALGGPGVGGGTGGGTAAGGGGGTVVGGGTVGGGTVPPGAATGGWSVVPGCRACTGWMGFVAGRADVRSTAGRTGPAGCGRAAV